jgi:hypothetical protein
LRCILAPAAPTTSLCMAPQRNAKLHPLRPQQAYAWPPKDVQSCTRCEHSKPMYGSPKDVQGYTRCDHSNPMRGPQKTCRASRLGHERYRASGEDLLRMSLLSASSSIELTDLVRSAVRVLPSGCGSRRVLQYCSHCSRFHLGASSRPSAPAITACISRHSC